MRIHGSTLVSIDGMLLPADDNCATRQIRCRRRLDWDEQFNSVPEIAGLTPGKVVFDVGAWVGDTAKTFLRRGCEVHAFEPRPDNFVCLLHNCPDAHCYNLALGNGERHSTDRRGGNTGAYPLLPGNKYSVRLDDLNVHRLDFLKVDVEGFEISVLRGAENTLRGLLPTMHIECNEVGLARFGHKSEDVIKTLQSFGYSAFRCVYRYGNSQSDWICTP